MEGNVAAKNVFISPPGRLTFYRWHLMSPLSFDKGWTDRNADCCVNIDDENITTATNLVNCGPVTPGIW